MEQVHGVPARGNNSELEKFKRRLIRAVARMLIQEKRNEDEVWAGLKEETGFDCKELWNRMYALTVKKLERLLEAEDRVNNLPKAARMTITDWLMFDTVLVHEDFDVIGMSETVMEDRKVLVDLFDLVEKYKIEFLAGDQLTDAWLKLTMHYNGEERQCTPMLLQRRWYQLKLSTRARFYKFWSLYKGVAKRRYLGEPYKPTKLQATIAMRYKPLVVKPFMLWEELLKNCLVILPEQFEYKGNNVRTNKPSKSVELGPDVLCVEPVVETIELDSDSETEIEYRKPVKNDDLATITIKKEPVDDLNIDDNTPYENRQERMLHFAEAAMEAAAMELNEIELATDSEAFLSSNSKVESENLPNDQSNKEIIIDDINPNQDNTTNLNENDVTEQTNNDIILDDINPNQDNIINLNEVENAVSAIAQDDSICIIEDQNNAVPPISENHVNAINEENNVNSEESPLFDNEVESLPVSDSIVKEVHLVEDEEPESNDTEMPIEQESMLPQITSIFGGVDISNETLSKISLLTAQITNSANKDKPKTSSEFQIESVTSIALNSDSSNANNDVLVPDETLDDKSNTDVDAKVTKHTWFGELSNDIDFADDGIQLIDDDDDESAYQSEIKTEIKCEIDEEDTIFKNEEEDVPKVDEKLLMLPTVKMVKLDDMNILPIHLLTHIDNKSLIDVIAFKNNPIKKSVAPVKPSHHPLVIKQDVDVLVPIKQEDASVPKPIRSSIRIKFEDDESEPSDEEIIDESKKVKLSSTLLQKPRNRSYSFINLCKNPDFNTRLKKLNIGFFSSARNRLLLKACKPLSIDVSKAFESKLVKGTMYLKMSNNDDPHTHTYTTPKVSSQNVSVLPSAMAVQCLIDNTNGDIPPSSYSSMPLKPMPLTCQRNKIINLPDISEIRRINQNLLTAEVTPLRLTSSHNQVPVTLVKTANIDQNVHSTKHGKAVAGPASRTNQRISQIIDITKTDNTNTLHTKNTVGNKDSVKPVTKTTWRPKLKPEIPWFSNKNSIYSEDTLLALDTLNKMLYLLIETDPTLNDNSGSSKGGSNGKKGNKKRSLPKETKPTLKPSLNDNDNDDVQLVSETKLDNADVKLCRKPNINQTNPGSKKSKIVYCCWARERICQLLFTKTRISKHNCPFPLCLCCCRNVLLRFIRKKAMCDRIKKTKGADLSIVDVSEISTADDTIDIENIDGSADMVEIIPINNKTAANEAAVSTDNEKSSNETTINIDAEMSTNETAANTNTTIKETNVSTNEVAVNTDTEIFTSENTIDIDSEMSANKTAVNTDTVSMNTKTSTNETAVCCDEPIQDIETQINDKSSNDVIIGAEISVKTSDNLISIHSKDPVTVDSQDATITNPNITPYIHTKPRIRIKPALGPIGTNFKRKTYGVNNRRLQNQRIVPTEDLTTMEKPKNVAIIDPSNSLNIIENSQKAESLDPTVPKILPKTYINQKMIYLNSKQISTLPSDNPIYLGKNKILLTTAKFPVNFKAFEAYVANLKQTFALPKGIQLVLLPSGRVTYIRDSKQSISEEFMKALPHLLIAIQQHIDHPPVQSTNVQISSSEPEVIDLSEDEPADVVNDTERTSSDEVSADNINQINKTDTENTVETETATINLDGPKTTESPINGSTQQSDVNISELVTTNVETVECESGKSNDSVVTENANVNTQTDASISESVTSDIETAESDSGKCNNILSDLMAMSGIEPLDVTPSPQLPVAGQVEGMPAQIAHSSLLQPVNSSSKQNSSFPSVHKSGAEHAENMEANFRKILSAELTPITSLAELKYACAQSGSFFKLDLETGLLLAINVCMKKFTENERTINNSKSIKFKPKTFKRIDPKPVIDLTDDDVSAVPEITPTQPINQSTVYCDENVINSDIQVTHNVTEYINPKGVDMNFTIASVSSESTISNHNIDPSIGGTNVTKDGLVKPLKIYKIVEGRPTILERKLKEIQHRIKVAQLNQDVLRRKLKRKQEQYNSARNENTENSYKIVSSDDSSDEEPLAKIASKMRTAEKTHTDNTMEVNNHPTNETDLPVRSVQKLADELPNTVNESPNAVNKLLDTVDEQMNDDPDLPMEEDEEIPMECLDETILDEDDVEDNCILGV